MSLLYYSGHGDLAAEADGAGARTAAYSYDPFGSPLQSTPTNTTSERWTGGFDKKLDTATGLIEMGARPYDPVLGRFLAVDPVEGGSANNCDYAGQDPVNAYDLDGRRAIFDDIPGAVETARKLHILRVDHVCQDCFPQTQSSGKLVFVVGGTYAAQCALGAAQGAAISGAVGAFGGCAVAIIIELGKKSDGRVGRVARAADAVTAAVDVRRAAYKSLGVPKFRELWKVYRFPRAQPTGR